VGSKSHHGEYMHTIFLSHISEEAELANALKGWIESTFAGQCKVFVSSSPDDLPPGRKWLDQIDTALEMSEALLVLCSPLSINRPWINFETGCAWVKKVPIFPICHSGKKVDQLPQPLAQFQALELSNGNFSRQLIAGLARHFQISHIPRISHDQMTKELQAAESALSTLYLNDRASAQSEKVVSASSASLPNRSVNTATETPSSESSPTYRLTITTGIGENGLPEDSREVVSFSDKMICFFIKWFHLVPHKDYQFIWYIFDGAGEMIHVGEFLITPRDRTWDSWHWYSLSKNVDKPGRWTFIGYLEGQKIIERQVDLEP
jgi:hypothetical protein